MHGMTGFELWEGVFTAYAIQTVPRWTFPQLAFPSWTFPDRQFPEDISPMERSPTDSSLNWQFPEIQGKPNNNKHLWFYFLYKMLFCSKT